MAGRLLRCLAVLAVLTPAGVRPGAATEPATPPRPVAVFPIEIADTSGEPPRPGHPGRVAAVTAELAGMLAASDRYRPVDLEPVRLRLAAAGPLHLCGGCWSALAGDAGAELALVTVVHKMSTLVSSMHVWVLEVATGSIVRKAAVSLRGDTDEAWRRAAANLARTSILPERAPRQSLSSPFPGG